MFLQDKGRLGTEGHVRFRKANHRFPPKKEAACQYNSLLQCEVALEGKIIGQCFGSCQEIKCNSTWRSNRETNCINFDREAKQRKDKGGGKIVIFLNYYKLSLFSSHFGRKVDVRRSLKKLPIGNCLWSLLIWLLKFGGMSKKTQKETKKSNNLHNYFNKNSQADDKNLP